MKIVKTAYQDTSSAHETVYFVRGLFRKRFYRLDITGVVELPVYRGDKNGNA